MTDAQIKMLISMVLYMAVVIAIGVYFSKRANKSSNEYFLGGRSLGPWVTAMSAEASDMSGWLLMGLPGVAYWMGLADAFWTAVGLAVGTYINWLIVAKRLRRYSVKIDAITVPDYFSRRFHEADGKKVLLTVASLFILVFFSVYAGSCFVACGKLFSTLFGLPYVPMMIIGAVFVIVYTFLGGFLAESASDFMQAIVMIVALSVILTLSTLSAGGIGAVLENAKNIPGFFDLFGIASPVIGENGIQLVENGKPIFGEAGAYGIITVLSTLSWGLGYFGMPQVLLRFMAARKTSEIKMSRRIATVWVIISLFAAVTIGIIGRAMLPTEEALLSSSGAENVFIIICGKLLPPILAGIIMSGILAATISSSDSYLLIAASAFSKNLYQGVFHKRATDKQVMRCSKIILVVIALFGVIVALDENSVIFNVVSFAWAGFGAAFGPLMLISLFWKKVTHTAAVAGMLSGGAMVFIWEYIFTPFGKANGISVLTVYELLPAFLLGTAVIFIVSKFTKAPAKEITDEFDSIAAVE
ncbi:MAG: sodium/proline symporter [Oscillospiraceae bacterium]|nr:sodium/proline symporter [Oscillospiraceae bacterium]